MTEEKKQALIEHAKSWIADCEAMRDEIPFGFDDDTEKELSLIKIALAALTAQPGLVLRPFGEDSQNTFIKCENNHPLAMKLFTRPAPTADLAELVPEEMPRQYQNGWPLGHSDEATGWNACRAEMLRKIEEAK